MNAKQSILWGSAALAAGAAGRLLSRAARARRLHDDVARLFAGAADPSRHIYREFTPTSFKNALLQPLSPHPAPTPRHDENQLPS